MKNLILIYAFIALTFGCAAQSNVPSNAKDILISKSWVIDGADSHEYKIIFTDTKMTTFSAGIIIGEDEYYLSDDLGQCSPNNFIQNNVGNSNTGKYLITKDFCFELIIVSSTKWEFKNLKLNIEMLAIPE